MSSSSRSKNTVVANRSQRRQANDLLQDDQPQDSSDNSDNDQSQLRRSTRKTRKPKHLSNEKSSDGDQDNSSLDGWNGRSATGKEECNNDLAPTSSKARGLQYPSPKASRRRKGNVLNATRNGESRIDDDGSLQWKDPTDGNWRLAVYHKDIRAEPIEAASIAGEYTFPRQRGAAENDVTSFLEEQENWGEARDNRPDILFQYEPRPENVAKKAELWVLEDRIVLDSNDEALLDYAEIPWTCSSNMEGWLMEAIIRLNLAIRSKDFLQRMPGKSKISENKLSMRRTRFRGRATCISWKQREGTETLKKYLDSNLPLACRRANSTKDFHDLEFEERVAMTKENFGRYPKRSRTYRRDNDDDADFSQPVTPRDNRGRPRVDSSDSESDGRMCEGYDSSQEDKTADGGGKKHYSTEGDSIEDAQEEALDDDEDEDDFLYATADTHDHQQLLRHLLVPTRAEYFLVTGQHAPIADSEASYVGQYGDLATALMIWWTNHGMTEDIPLLVGVVAIDETTVSWNREDAPPWPPMSRSCCVVWLATGCGVDSRSWKHKI